MASVIQFPKKIRAARTPEAIHGLACRNAERQDGGWYIVAFEHYEPGNEDVGFRHRIDLDWFGGTAPVRTMCGHDIESAMDYEQAWAPMRSEYMPELAKCALCLIDDETILRKVAED